MKTSSWQLLGVLLVILLFTLPSVNASDDTNSQNLSSYVSVSVQEVTSALSSMSQNLTGSDFTQALNQFNSQLSAGNFNAAASTLITLRADAQNDPQASAGLKALLQSLSVGSNGLSLNSGVLSSLLGLNSLLPYGVPSGLAGESPQQLSIDLNSLGNLLRGVNPSMSADVLGLLQTGAGGGSAGPPGSFQLGNLKLPGISPPTVNPTGAGSAFNFGPQGLVFPGVLMATAAILFLLRDRIRMLLGRQASPTDLGLEDYGDYPGLNLNDPRQKVYILFGRTVRLMRSRGVSKMKSETHREFASKVEPRPEGRSVQVVSSLYEKARFTTLEVGDNDVDRAKSVVSALEEGA